MIQWYLNFSIRAAQIDTVEEAMIKATKMVEIMIETCTDLEIIFGKVQRDKGNLNIDDQVASSSKRNEE